MSTPLYDWTQIPGRAEFLKYNLAEIVWLKDLIGQALNDPTSFIGQELVLQEWLDSFEAWDSADLARTMMANPRNRLNAYLSGSTSSIMSPPTIPPPLMSLSAAVAARRAIPTVAVAASRAPRPPGAMSTIGRVVPAVIVPRSPTFPSSIIRASPAGTLPTMITEPIPIGEQAEQKNRLQDRDGKYYVAFNKATIVGDLEMSSPFRRICDPDRLPHLLQLDGTKLDTSVINSQLQRIVLLDGTHISPGL